MEVEIFPQYAQNDAGHRLYHIEHVMRRSFQFANYAERHNTTYRLNYDIVLVAAAYHDLGHHVDPKNHEEISAQMLENDQTIYNFLKPNELKIAVQAIKQHRSHNSVCGRDIYGKILALADCNINIDAMLRRTYAYRVKKYSNLNIDEIIESSRQHLINKYVVESYTCDKMYFLDPDFLNTLEELQHLTANPLKFQERYIAVNKLGLE